MTYKTILMIISSLFTVVGFLCLSYVNWLIALGVFFVIWGTNLENKTKMQHPK